MTLTDEAERPEPDLYGIMDLLRKENDLIRRQRDEARADRDALREDLRRTTLAWERGVNFMVRVGAATGKAGAWSNKVIDIYERHIAKLRRMLEASHERTADLDRRAL